MVSTAKNVAAGLGVLLLICMNGCGVSSQRRGRLGAGINIAKEFDCPEEFGYYPHPHDCTMYYVCVFGGALLESCTGGLMYSQELQTCDWPRNVGCTVSEVETATTPTTRVTEPRSRHTTATQARNNPAISAREQSQRQQQDEIAKHQLYADDVGPAEEVETDRQQRVYRGQPATITLGQNLDTRHQVTNAIPSPSGRIASGDKIGVISFGTQHNQQQQQHQQPQQHSQYRVEPTSAPSAYVQELLAPTKASPLYNGSQQYDLTQYDPYYSLYDEDVELYRDVDYGQFPSNQGNQQSNGNQYRGNQNSFKQAEERPAVQQQQPQQPERNSAAGYAQQQPAYIAQDAYAQTVSAPAQQDFNQNSYGQSQQTGDQGQYQPRTPIKAPPTRQQTRLRPETADGVSLSSRQTQTANLVPVPYPLPVPSAVTTHYPLPVPTAVPTPVPITRDITQTKHVVRRVLLKAAVVLRDPLKSLESQPDNRSSSKRIAFANRDENNAQPKSRQGSSKIITLSTSGGNSRVDNEPKTYTGSSFIVSNPEPHVREQTNPDPIQSSRNTDSRFIVDSLYVDLSGPSPTQLVFIESSSTTSTTSQPETVSKYLLRRSSTVPSTTVKAQAERKNLASRKAFFRATIENVKDYNSDAVVASRIPAQDDIASPVIIRSRSQIRKTTQTTVPELEDVPSSEDPPRVPVQDGIGGVTSPAIIRSRPQIRKQIKTAISELEGNSFSVDSPHVPVQDDTGDTSSPAIVRARPQIRKPIKTTIPELEQTSFSEDPISFNSLSPDNSQLPTEATSPARTRIASGRIALSQNTPKCSEGKANSCNEIPQIRIRPTTASPDYQATPGPVRGSVRNRGNQAYNSASGETPNRGTPAPITRSRPTLKPSTAIVSKAQEFIDIYRFGEASRPEPVYATPQVDKTAAKCRKDVCLLPDCSCGGKEIPGDLPAETVPQIVLLTFDDSVNDLNKGLYSSLFEKGRVNPNGCPIAATFYVSHEWTNYGQVQSLYADGHEIASHSVSHSFGEQFSQKKWTREIAGQREILAAYGGVRVEDVRGMRAPFLSVGGNKMFKMLYDSNFTYDSSMPVYENKPPSYPYTFDYKIFHDCMIPPCPTRSYPGVWEVPMVMWQDLNGGRCSMGDACSNPPTADGVYKMLIKNFERHYTTNRAPFGLFYHAAWFTQVHHKEGFEAFLDTIVNMPDVWLVTNWQALQWVRDPTPISRINSFQPFQCNYPERPKRCNSPKVCNLWHKTGVRYMKTCQPCPDIYPWTGKSGVRNSRVDNEIIDE